MWSVRTMTEADIPAVSAVRVSGWKAAYAGMIPQLWVLRGNVTARRFCERAGYASDGAVQSDDYDGVSVPEVRYRRALHRITQRPPVPR